PLTIEDVISERCGVRPLVIEAGASGKRDWLALSRKHAIDVNQDLAHMSIFGGKLTDCLNVGDEICKRVKRLGILIPHPRHRWFGEPPENMKKAFFHQAALMSLDHYIPSDSTEKLSCRLWRRYGVEAIHLLEIIQRDPKQAEVLIKGTEYLRCELQLAAQQEMIVKLDDFLRRRSKIALNARQRDLKQSPGLMEACEILFGKHAREKFDEYFRES